jgi:phenylpropionate dioxygenase-like ring-hydroxylating dioxygenase large terminal subunit
VSIDIEVFLDPATVGKRAAAARAAASASRSGDGYELDVADYVDADQYEAEVEVFRGSWHIAATSAELAKSGDYIRWDFTPRPVVVVRAKDGDLHAFYDVCAHRGGPIAPETTGSVRSFVCPYHNWTYDLTGQLVAIPSAEHFPDLCIEDRRLSPVRVAELGGLAWINEDPDAQDLQSWLGSVSASLERGRLEEFTLASHQRYLVDSNWKISTEGGIDTYHIDFLHQSTARGVLDNGGTLVAFDGPHSTAIVPLLRPELATSYLPDAGGVHVPGNVQCWAFPTHTVSLFPYAVAVISHYPSAIDQTVVDWRVLVHREIDDPATRAEIVENYEAVFAEDRALSPRIQKNMESGVMQHLQLSVKEDRVHHFHTSVADAIRKLPARR